MLKLLIASLLEFVEGGHCKSEGGRVSLCELFSRNEGE